MAVRERIEAVLGGDREIAGHEKAHADARDRAVHAGDQRLTDAAQLQDQRMDVMDEFLEAPRPRGRRQRRYLREELDVAARHEAAAGASQYDDSYGRVGFYAIDRRFEGRAHGVVQRVQHLGPVEGQRGDAGHSRRARRCRSLRSAPRLLRAVAV
jgi:hypothetical protein